MRTPGPGDPQERFDSYARAKAAEDEGWLAKQQTRSHPPAPLAQPQAAADSTRPPPQVPPPAGSHVEDSRYIAVEEPKAVEPKLQPLHLGFEEKFAALRRNLIGGKEAVTSLAA